MKPIPIQEALQSDDPELKEMTQELTEKLKSGEISMCACVGPMYGEPHCPCRMTALGLPSSEEHIKANNEAKQRLNELFGPGGLYYQNKTDK